MLAKTIDFEKLAAKKLNIPVLPTVKEGEHFAGILEEILQRELPDKRTKVLKMKNFYRMRDPRKPAGSEKFLVIGDAGLDTMIFNSAIKVGDCFIARKGSKKDIGGGQSVNTWDIFSVTSEELKGL